MKSLAILGSTGSIGTSTLEVVRHNKDKFRVEFLLANSNYQLMIEQCEEFQPKYIYLRSEEAKRSFLSNIGQLSNKTTLLSSDDEVEQVLGSEFIDTVVAAIVGFAGLKPVYHSLKNGKHVLLANKESYVVAGEFLNKISKESNSTIFPIDSEHSAIHQCLQGIENKDSISRLILTGSGGPFLKRNFNDFISITPQEAVAHPVWNMGEKISVDSSTMMNKCLEIIEARWLFDIEDIEVIIHPEGIVHSMVEFNDGSIKAQMGEPDMKLPIQFALGYPERLRNNFKKFNFLKNNTLNFEKPCLKTFNNLKLAFEAGLRGGNSPCILNASNEVVVEAFLNEKINYLDMTKFIEDSLNKISYIATPNLEQLIETDLLTRNFINKKIKSL